MEPIEQYRLRKLIYQLMFNFEDTNYDEEAYLYDLVAVGSLRNIVEYHAKHNDLSKDVIYNINKFLSQAREYNDEHRLERIEIINDIIRIMNGQEKDNSLVYYRIQLYERTKDYRYLLKSTNEEIIKEIPMIHESICNDLLVLVSHMEDINDMEFANEFLPDLVNNELYYESLNMILLENPIVFKDKTFYNRMMCVLNFNNLTHQELEEKNEKLVKKINKKIKRIK